jgi:hypothetical protein
MRVLITTFAIALLAAACGGSRSGVNVAPEVQPSMYRISEQMLALDRAMSIADPAERKKNLLTSLERLTEITRELTTPELRKSHALMDTEIDAFFAEIVKAREAAAAEPPNYYWAGRLHSTCVRCHDPEGGVWKK